MDHCGDVVCGGGPLTSAPVFLVPVPDDKSTKTKITRRKNNRKSKFTGAGKTKTSKNKKPKRLEQSFKAKRKTPRTTKQCQKLKQKKLDEILDLLGDTEDSEEDMLSSTSENDT